MEKKILVVDDDAMNLRMAEFILKKAGYEVKKAASGEECLGMLAAELPELVLLDIEMPVMNGFEVMEKIKEHEEWAGLPVAFLSADMDDETQEKAGKLGVTAYITKPFLPDTLCAKVADILK